MLGILMSGESSFQRLVALFHLKPHPEGGFFAETFRSADRITLPDGRVRSTNTAIYFLLPSGSFSALHRVSSDEVWHHYDGASIELTTIDAGGRLERTVLGRDFEAGEHPQHVVPAGVWQGARPIGPGYAFAGCTVAPGFDFEDFEMPGRAVMERLFPQHTAVIRELTRTESKIL